MLLVAIRIRRSTGKEIPLKDIQEKAAAMNILTAYEILSLVIGILTLLIAFGSLIVAFLAFLDRKHKKK